MFTPVLVDASTVPHVAVLADGTRVEVAPPPASKTAVLVPVPVPELPSASAVVAAAPTVQRPLGSVAMARSGDKGGSANIGVWVSTDDAFAWLADLLTIDRLQALLPESAGLPVERHLLPNLRAVNFVIEGILGEGVASNARFDPQAKALGEWLLSRVVAVPAVLLPANQNEVNR